MKNSGMQSGMAQTLVAAPDCTYIYLYARPPRAPRAAFNLPQLSRAQQSQAA